jgi:hypothetical protein
MTAPYAYVNGLEEADNTLFLGAYDGSIVQVTIEGGPLYGVALPIQLELDADGEEFSSTHVAGYFYTAELAEAAYKAFRAIALGGEA